MAAPRHDGSSIRLAPELAVLLHQLDESYERKAWHGPNLKGSIRGLTVEQVAWRPSPARHSIVEHVIHAAYWKYAVRRRLRRDERGSFPLRGSNWFAVAPAPDLAAWKGYVKILETEHRILRDAVARFPCEKLFDLAEGGKVTNLMLISGIASHDVYHAGQIQLLKRLQDSGKPRTA
ncbi:MAG: DinB family protein [Isosphaeraceae bacterium]